jgi:hypothetical protein
MYEAIGSAVGAFAGAAASGQVSVDPDAAQEALTEIGNVKAELEDLLHTGGDAQFQVQLGSNQIGEAMAAKSLGRYGGDDSFMAAVKQLLQETEKAERALQQSIQNYVDTDTGSSQKYR